jgi:hypothetical protein
MITTIHTQTAIALLKGVSELRELLRTMGHEPDLINTHQLQEIAEILSALAGKQPAWGWKYLNQVLHNKLAASQQLITAIHQQGMLSDGVNATLATSTKLIAYAPSGVTVHPGSLILTDSRQCPCGLWFIPRAWNQNYHSHECRAAARKQKKGIKP